MKFFSSVSVSLILFTKVLSATDDACYPKEESLAPGFKVDFVEAEAYGGSGLSERLSEADMLSYLDYLRTKESFESTYGVTNVLIDESSYPYTDPPEPYTAPIYNTEINAYFFAMRLSGYYLAETTGEYTFYASSDDGAMIQIGNGVAFDCCQDPIGTGSQPSSPQQVTTATGLGSPVGKPLTISLTAGVYYPITVLNYNQVGGVYFDILVTTPGGPEQESISNVFYLATPGLDQCEPKILGTTTFTTRTVSTLTAPIDVTTCPEHGYCSVAHLVPPPVIVTTTVSATRSDTTTATYEASGSNPGSVVIEVPIIPTLTTTVTAERSDTTTITYAESGSARGSVVVEVPPIETTTITTTVSRSDTTTITYEASGSNSASVVVEVPAPQVVTTTITASREDTTTVTYEASGSLPGSVVIELPSPEEVTTTITVSRTDTTTVTYEPSNSDPGSVVIEVPIPVTSTVATTITSNNTDTTTTTLEPTSSKSSFIIGSSISSNFETITVTKSHITVPTTITVDPSGTNAGTIIIEQPLCSTTTVTQVSIISTTTSLIPAHGSQAATLVVCVPPAGRRTVTVTKPCPICTVEATSFEFPEDENVITKWIQNPSSEKYKISSVDEVSVSSDKVSNTVSSEMDLSGTTFTSSVSSPPPIQTVSEDNGVFMIPSIMTFVILLLSIVC